MIHTETRQQQLIRLSREVHMHFEYIRREVSALNVPDALELHTRIMEGDNLAGILQAELEADRNAGETARTELDALLGGMGVDL